MRGLFSRLSLLSSLTQSSDPNSARRNGGLVLDDHEEFKANIMSSKSSRRTSLSSNSRSRFSLDSPTETSLGLSGTTLGSGSGNPMTSCCTCEAKKNCSFTCSDSLVGEPGVAMAKVGEEDLLLYSREELRVLSCSDLSTRLSFGGGNSPVKTVLVRKQFIFTAHEDLKIRAWKKDQQEEPKLIATLPSLQDCILNYMLPSGHVQIRRHKKTLKIQHYDAIAALALAADGTLLYSGSWDRTIKVWKATTFKCVESFQAHEDAVNALAASRDGYLYSASSDGTVKVWERGLDSRHLLTTSFHRHQSGVNALALSGDEEYLYSGSGDKSIIVWEMEDSAGHMNATQVLRGHGHAVLCLASTASVLCSGSADKTVRIWQRWKAKDNQHLCMAILRGHTGPVKSLAASQSSDRCRVYSRSLDGNLKAWWGTLSSEQHATDEDSEC